MNWLVTEVLVFAAVASFVGLGKALVAGADLAAADSSLGSRWSVRLALLHLAASAVLLIDVALLVMYAVGVVWRYELVAERLFPHLSLTSTGGGAWLRLLTRPKSIETLGICGIRVLTGI